MSLVMCGLAIPTAILTLARSVEIRLPRKAMGGPPRSAPAQIDIAAGSSLLLRPGAPHLMLVGLGQALKKGMRVPLTLEFETQEGLRSSVNINAEVVSANAHSALDHHH